MVVVVVAAAVAVFVVAVVVVVVVCFVRFLRIMSNRSPFCVVLVAVSPLLGGFSLSDLLG